MIHVDRQRVAIPPILVSERAERELAAAEDAYAGAEKRKGYVKFEFRLYREIEVRRALSKLFRDKCAFCESKVGITAHPDIEHFRPKSNCVDERGRHFPLHYWWLASTWANLYLACQRCNRSKANRFPILGERSPIQGGPESLEAERPLLLDPCIDRPEKHLRFDREGRVNGLTERGQASIELFDLNRRTLVERRREVVEEMTVSRLLVARDEMLREDQEFLALRRQLAGVERERGRTRGPTRGVGAEPYLGFDRDESFSLSIEDTAVPKSGADTILGKVLEKAETFSLASQTRALGGGEPAEIDAEQAEVESRRYFLRHRPIESITLRDFKAIEELTIRCAPGVAEHAGWTMFLGENGTGKSSVLEAVALALAGRDYRESLLRSIDDDKTPEENAIDLIRRPRQGVEPERAEIIIEQVGGETAILKIHADGTIEANEMADAGRTLLLGYGATRLLPRHAIEPRGTDYARADNLFDPFEPLGDARRWLLGLDEATFEDTEPALAELLGLDHDRGEALVQNHDRRRIDVHLFDSQVPLEQLSAGYQSVVALAADIMSILRERWETSMVVAEGVVLLDEIGAHLHPKWRMRLVRSLRDTFPRVQFLVTTHDPLCLRGLEDGEVISMRRDRDGRVYAITNLPPVAGLRVDQLLTSEHFGLSSTIDPELEEEFEEYYELLLRQDRGEALGDEDAARLAELREKLAEMRQLGETRRERLMLEAIDRHLAREPTLSAAERERAESELEHDLDDLLEGLEV